MSTAQRPPSTRVPPAPRPRAVRLVPAAVRRLGVVLHVVLVCAAVAGISAVAVPLLGSRPAAAPPVLPAAMEEVDWSHPESSVFCLACHRDVAPAMAGADVEHGHPQNVKLNETQLAALDELGTVAGPDGTLICMSCHKLGTDARAPHMLADALAGSRLCQHCHEGHYAKDTPHDLRISAPDERNRRGQTVAEGGPCSACHLAHRTARGFVRSPLDPDGRCLTCHAQYGLAAGHPRTSMDHPEARCAECHDPHSMAHGEFLKADINELCIRCHKSLDGGVAHGMHPLGPMDRDVPEALLAAGAVVGDDRRLLTCRVCHTSHQARHENLLVLSTAANELCLACHQADLVAHTHDGALPRHGQAPVLDEEQRRVVARLGNRTGPGGELLCVSCHDVHGAQQAAHLVSFPPQYGESCVACHPNQGGVFGSSHDLRTNFPREQNAAGLTPAAHGACSACHMVHGPARSAQIGPGDPAGACVTCHQAGQCGQGKLAGGVQHPQTACTDCHDPHDPSRGKYLAQDEAELCVRCHAEQGALAGGPHDPARDPERWPATSVRAGGRCLPCHVPHGGARADLFRVGGTPVGHHDEVCLSCHADAGWNAAGSVAAIHPHEISPEQHKVELALVPKDDAGNLRMGCRTCHNPHGGAEPAHLARVTAGAPTESLCLHCHASKGLMRHTGHAAEGFAKLGLDTDSCKPCHAMHADRDGSWGQMLSPRFLLAQCGDPQDVQSCVPCLACHHPQGPAPVRAVASHPAMIMRNIAAPGEPGYLPLFNAAGHEDQNGQVACRTCHVSHGRLDLLQRLAESPDLTAEEREAVRVQLRPFETPNVCTACHGPEARDKFLRFHDPRRRGTTTVLPARGL